MSVLALRGNGDRGCNIIYEVYGDYDPVMTEGVMDRIPRPATLIRNSGIKANACLGHKRSRLHRLQLGCQTSRVRVSCRGVRWFFHRPTRTFAAELRSGCIQGDIRDYSQVLRFGGQPRLDEQLAPVGGALRLVHSILYSLSDRCLIYDDPIKDFGIGS